MKKISLLLFLIGFNFVFSQAQTPETPTDQDTIESQSSPDNFKSQAYPGGMMKLREDIANKFNLNQIKEKGIYTAKAKVIINTRGRIENIVVTGDNIDFNKEIEKAIRRIKAKWKPAEHKGMLVCSYYTIPFTLTIE